MSKEKEQSKWDMSPGAQPVTILRFYNNGNYALTVDVKDLVDPTKPQAKLNFVINKKIVKSISFAELIEGFYDY